MLRYVENLHSYASDARRRGEEGQRVNVESLRAERARLTKRVERLKGQLLKQQMLNYELIRRVQELQQELARRDRESRDVVAEARAPAVVRRDSHNSSLPPSLDLPGAKAANAAARRRRSLRQKSDRSVGGQVGHKGATLRQVGTPDRLRVHEPYYCRSCDARPGRLRGGGPAASSGLRCPFGRRQDIGSKC